MKRIHFLFLLFPLSFYVCATSSSQMTPVEIHPVGSDQLNPRWSKDSVVVMVPPVAPTSQIMQVMRATIEAQTNEINDLKSRISVIENKLKDNER